MMSAIAKVENRQLKTCKEIFGESLIERFTKFAGVGESSQKTYAKCLRLLGQYFAAKAIDKPTREDLIDWLASLSAQRKSASTIQLYLAAAKIFFRWLSQEKLFQNIADHLKAGVKPSHNHKKDALTNEECKALIKNVKGKKEKDLRDRAVLSLMSTAGLRTIEVVRADIEDIRHERGKVFLYVQGKGHSAKDEKVLIATQTYSAIKAYLKARGKIQGSEPLFVSTSRRNKGARLDTQTIRKMVKENLRGIGLDTPRLTAHSLRHSVATNLIFERVDLPKVQMILRHKSLNTTMIYANAWERYNNNDEQILADCIFN